MTFARATGIPLALGLVTASLAAQSTTWLGAVSNDWRRATNWSNGVPTAGVDAIVPGLRTAPVISAASSCRSLTVNAGGSVAIADRITLDLYGNASVSGSIVGTGRLVTMGTVSTLTGRFANVVANSTTRLTAGSILSGELLANASVLLNSGCSLGALRIGSGATVTVQTSATSSVVVTGNLVVAAGGTLVNPSAVPVVLRGPSHNVAGPVQGDVSFEVAAATNLGLSATITGSVRVATGGQAVTVTGGGVGRITGGLEVISSGVRCDLFLDGVHAGDVNLRVTTTRIVGTVTCAEFRVQDTELLGAGTTEELICDTLVIFGSSQVFQSPPNRIVVRNGITITGSNTFAPLRGTIVFNDPAQPTTVGVSDQPLPRFSQVRVENGAQVQFRSGGSNISGKGPRIQNLIVTQGSVDAVYCAIDALLVEPAGSLVVRTELAADQCVLGPTTIRGAATFTDTDFGGALVPNSLTVENGGNALVGNGTLSVTGDLRVSNATLRLGSNVALLLSTTGRLVLDGTPTAPAVVAGTNSTFQLDGRIDARSFRISGMNTSGVRVGGTATLGAVPFDFRGGHFTGGRPGGVLLDLVRAAPTTLYDLDFDAVGGQTRNVRATTASAAITVVDARGGLAGEAFDDDAGNRIGWRANATAVAEFSAQPGVFRSLVSFRTTAEETTAFRLNRSPAPALVTLAATGPRTYAFVDDGLLAGTRYTYTLERERLSPFSAQWQALATAGATPHRRDEGITRFVGPNAYPDVASALSGAPPGTIVFVSAGTYGGFAVAQAVRVLGEGQVTFTSPVTISNVPAGGGDVVLDGLDFAPAARLAVTDVALPVILRDLVLHGAGDGLRIERCPRVALQRLGVTNATRLVTATTHASNCTFNVVNVTQNSRLVHAATNGSITPDGSSTVSANPGPSALLDLAPTWPTGQAQSLRVHSGGNGHAFGLLLATAHAYVDLSAIVPLDMVLLVSPSLLIALPGGILDAAGSASITIPGPPNSGTVGLSVQLQVHTLDPATVRGRFAEVRQVLLLR